MNLFHRLFGREPKDGRVGLMVPSMSFTGDAVSRDVIGMYHALEAMGYEPSVYTSSQKAGGLRTKPYEAAPRLNGPDLLIYHYCTGDQKALEIIGALKCRIAIKYHNVTPSRFYEPYSPAYTEATVRAREMLPKFTKIPGLHGIADSSFNRDELTALGMSSVDVVPPFHQISELLNAPIDPTKEPNRITIITVGRIAPNKGLEQSIAAFLEASASSSTPMHLDIVGGSDERIFGYKDKLIALVGERKNVRFIESASVAELAALYRNADAYLTASEHEGFCVPVVEAMAFGVPVIASDNGALPETCGNAAVICKSHPDVVQALLNLPNEKNEIGLVRYQSLYSEHAIRAAFAGVITRIAPMEYSAQLAV